MQMQNNTIFITGGTSGIGKGLAEAFHKRGNQVIISGRREQRLKEVCQQNPGMKYFELDVTDEKAIREIAAKAVAQFPKLNCVINNSGVQVAVSFADGKFDDGALQQEVSTNVLGPMRMAAAFLPHLKEQPHATLINVSSGLAFVPMARFPVYCATKAAIHSWTMSLRQQLRGSGVQVVELIPPWVATELGGPRKPNTTTDGRSPMPLDAFITETMEELESGGEELAIAESKRLVATTSPDAVKKVFAMMNS